MEILNKKMPIKNKCQSKKMHEHCSKSKVN